MVDGGGADDGAADPIDMAWRETLTERLSEIRQRYPAAEPAMVAEVVRAVLVVLAADLTAQEAALLAEVEELGRTIAAAKIEIAALQAGDITLDHIPSATDELDAIVMHTAAATDAILETCETLDRTAGELSGAAAAQLQAATTRIYEACSFQDITGQRITKVVATLKAIERKVAHITAAFGRSASPEPMQPMGGPPAGLLNGPQLPAAAMEQADIDRLLADF